MSEKKDNIHICFNTKVINKLREYEIPIDSMGTCLFILFALYEGKIELLDVFDDSNKQRRAIILYRFLESRGLIETTTVEDFAHYKLTITGASLVEFLKKELHADNNVEVTADKIVKVTETDLVAAWINDYVSLFPKKFQDNVKLLTPRMEDFIKTYEYSKEEILGGTRMYLKSQAESESGHQFTRRSIYFIVKGQGKDKVSDLATWCDKYKDFIEKGDTEFDTSIMNIA